MGNRAGRVEVGGIDGDCDLLSVYVCVLCVC